MKFKLVVALVDNSETDAVLECGRRAGATGATIITSCRGEGLQQRARLDERHEADLHSGGEEACEERV